MSAPLVWLCQQLLVLLSAPSSLSLSAGLSSHSALARFAACSFVFIGDYSASLTQQETRNLSSHTTCSSTPEAAAHFTSNHATVTVSKTVRLWPWTLTFGLQVNACRGLAIEYMCTKFGVDSISHFPFRARKLTQISPHSVTDATDHPIPHISYCWFEIITDAGVKHL